MAKIVNENNTFGAELKAFEAEGSTSKVEVREYKPSPIIDVKAYIRIRSETMFGRRRYNQSAIAHGLIEAAREH